MQLPSFKNLVYTDYPQQFQSLIEQLSTSLNTSITGILNSLNNNLTIADNFYATISTITVSVDATGTPVSTAAFAISNKNPIVGLLVLNATNKTNSSVYPTSGVFLSFTQSGSKVTITNITGLPPNNQFAIKVVAFLS